MSVREDFGTAIERGDSTQVKSLLTNGSIDINARLPREHNPPPLVLAVQCKPSPSVDIVELLLGAGALVDDVDDLGQTACFVAARALAHEILSARFASFLSENNSRGPLTACVHLLLAGNA
jgi:ankyrin repeat protein